MPSDLSDWMKSSKPSPSANPSQKKQAAFSLLTQILTQSDDQPLRPSEYPKILDSGPPAVLVNIDYQGDAGVAKLKLYDAKKGEIYEWLDNTGHHPYCLTDLTREEVSQDNNVVGHSGFLKLEEGPKYNLLLDKEQQYTVIVARDPLAIGGRPDSIREKLGRDHSWEADIRYTQCYTMDRTLTPGLLYRVQDKELVPVPQEFSVEDATKIRELFEKDKELTKLIEEYLPLFLTQATYLPRLALDIEVESEFIDRIPDPETAPQPVISVSIVDDTGTGRVYLLRRDSDDLGESKLPETVKIDFLEDERALLETVFRIIWRTPILLTFNGDNFDLRYLVNRAKKLGIPAPDIPIRMRGGFRGNPEASLEYGIHIDLYRFFHNRSIQIYAFRNRYREVRLENLSQALLGEGKLQLPDQISKIPTHLLAEYNWQDSHLTMRLSQFDNDLVMNLVLLLMRLSRQSMHDLTRTAVSNWIRSLLYYEHRQHNYLIPRQDEIAAFKGEAATEAIIKGKKYMGAIVVEPKEGVHFNVMVMDFACLSEDTEILTNLGWRSLDSVKKKVNNGSDFTIATVNSLSNKVEYQPLEKVHEYDYEGDMYHFLHNGVDLLVTPNHRMAFQRRTNDRQLMKWREALELEEAQNLCKRYWFRIPHFGTWVGHSHEIKLGSFSFTPEQFLPFLGWLLTDGSIKPRSIHIYQSKEKNFQSIRSSLELLGFKFHEKEYKSGQGRKYHRFDINNLEFTTALRKWLSAELGEKQKRIPRTILNFEKRHLQLLFDNLLLGDGSWTHEKCYSFSTTSKEFANDFQELALRLGYGCRINHVVRDCEIEGKIYKNHESYRAFLSYSRKNVFSGQHNRIHTTPYKGRVWCVSVPNGTIIARRNGKPAVTGNSLYPSIMKAYNLSYETVRCDHPECKDNLVPETPHWVCTRREGITSQIIGLIRDVRVEHFKPRAKDKTISPSQRNWFSVVEQALKVFTNASYGVLGAAHFPLYCVPVAESVTALGRFAITQTITKAEEIGVVVLYGDTDSLFLDNPTQAQLQQLIDFSEKELRVELDVEKEYRYVALSSRKKNYLGVSKDGQVDIKGLTGKKRNTPAFLQVAFMQMIDILRQVRNPDDFTAAKNRILRLAREKLTMLERREFLVEDLAIRVQLSKNVDAYVKTTPQHVKAARQLQKAGKEVTAGDIIAFVKTTGGVKPVEQATVQDIDITKYKDLVKSTFEQVLDALGIEWLDTIGMRRLDTFFG